MAIQIRTQSDSSQALRDLSRLNKSLDTVASSSAKTSQSMDRLSGAKSSGELKKVSKEATKASASVKDLTTNYKGLISSIASSIAITAAIVGFTKLSDSVSNLNNRLRVVADTNKDFETSLKNVRQIALATGNPLDGVANIYSKVALAGKRFNVSQSQTAKFTQNVSKSLAISGASAQEANSVIIQLGQGLGSNRLAGEELRAVLEGSQYLALQLAEGMGIPFETLRKEAELGRLTYSRVVNGMLKQSDKINESFEKINFTFSRAFKNLGTSINILFSEISENFTGDRGGLPGIIKDWADSIAASTDMIAYKIDLNVFKMKLLFVDIRNTLLSFAGIRVEFGVFNGVVDGLTSVRDNFNRFVYDVERNNMDAALTNLSKAIGGVGDTSKALFKAFRPESIIDTLAQLNSLGGGSKDVSFFISSISDAQTLSELMTKLSSHQLFKTFRNPAALGLFSGIGDELGMERFPAQLRNVITSTYAELLNGDTANVEEGAAFVRKQFESFLDKIGIEDIRAKSSDFAEVIESYVGTISEGLQSGVGQLAPFFENASSEELLERARQMFEGDSKVFKLLENLLLDKNADTRAIQVLLSAATTDYSRFQVASFQTASYGVESGSRALDATVRNSAQRNSAQLVSSFDQIEKSAETFGGNLVQNFGSTLTESVAILKGKIADLAGSQNLLTNEVVISLFKDIENGSKSAAASVGSVIDALKLIAADNNLSFGSLQGTIDEVRVYSELLEKVAGNASFDGAADGASRLKDIFSLTNEVLGMTSDLTKLTSTDIANRLADSLVGNSLKFGAAIMQYKRGVTEVQSVENFFGEEAARRLDGIVSNMALLGNYSGDSANIFSSFNIDVNRKDIGEFVKLWTSTNSKLIAERQKALGTLDSVKISSLDIIKDIYSNTQGDTLLDKMLSASDLKAKIAQVRNSAESEFANNTVEATIVTTGTGLQLVRDFGIIVDGFVDNSDRALRQVKNVQLGLLKDLAKATFSTGSEAFGFTDEKIAEFKQKASNILGTPLELNIKTADVLDGLDNIVSAGKEAAEELPDFFDKLFNDSKSEKFVSAMSGTFDAVVKSFKGIFGLFGSFDLSLDPLFDVTTITRLQVQISELASSFGDLFSPSMSSGFALDGLMEASGDTITAVKSLFDSLFNTNFNTDGFDTALKKVGDGFQETFQQIGTALSEIGSFGETVGKSISSLFSSSGGSAFVGAFTSGLGIVFGYFVTLFQTFSLKNIVQGFKDLYLGIAEGFKEGLVEALGDALTSEQGRRWTQFFGVSDINKTLTSVDSINGKQLDYAGMQEGSFGGVGQQRFNEYRPFLYEQFMAIPKEFQDGLSKAVLAAFGAAITLGLSFKTVGGGALVLFKKILALTIAAAFIDDGVAQSLTTVLGRAFSTVLSLFAGFFTTMPLELGILLAARIGLAFQPIRESFTRLLGGVAKAPFDLIKGFSEGIQRKGNDSALLNIRDLESGNNRSIKDLEATRQKLLTNRESLTNSLVSTNRKAGINITPAALEKATRQGTLAGNSKQFDQLISYNQRIAKSNGDLVNLQKSSVKLSRRLSLAESEDFRLNTNREERRNNFFGAASGIGSILGIGAGLYLTQTEGFGKAVDNILGATETAGKALTTFSFVLKTGLLVALPSALATVGGVAFSLISRSLLAIVVGASAIFLKPLLIIGAVIVGLTTAFNWLALSVYPGSNLMKGITALTSGFAALIILPAKIFTALSELSFDDVLQGLGEFNPFETLGNVAKAAAERLESLNNSLQDSSSAFRKVFGKVNDMLQFGLWAIQDFGLSIIGALAYFKLFSSPSLTERLGRFTKGIDLSATGLSNLSKKLKNIAGISAGGSVQDARLQASLMEKQAKTQAKALTNTLNASANRVTAQMLAMNINGVTDSAVNVKKNAVDGNFDKYGKKNIAAMTRLKSALDSQTLASKSVANSNDRLAAANRRVRVLERRDAMQAQRLATRQAGFTNSAGRAGSVIGGAVGTGLALSGVFSKFSDNIIVQIVAAVSSISLLSVAVEKLFSFVAGNLFKLGAMIVTGLGLKVVLGLGVLAALLVGLFPNIVSDAKDAPRQFGWDEFGKGVETPMETVNRVSDEAAIRMVASWDAIVAADLSTWQGWLTTVREVLASSIRGFVTGMSVIIAMFDALRDKLKIFLPEPLKGTNNASGAALNASVSVWMKIRKLVDSITGSELVSKASPEDWKALTQSVIQSRSVGVQSELMPESGMFTNASYGYVLDEILANSGQAQAGRVWADGAPTKVELPKADILGAGKDLAKSFGDNLGNAIKEPITKIVGAVSEEITKNTVIAKAPVKSELKEGDVSKLTAEEKGSEKFFPMKGIIRQIDDTRQRIDQLSANFLKPETSKEDKRLINEQLILLQSRLEEALLQLNTGLDERAGIASTRSNLDAAGKGIEGWVGMTQEKIEEFRSIFRNSADGFEAVKEILSRYGSSVFDIFKSPSVFSIEGIEPATLQEWQTSIATVLKKTINGAMEPLSLSLLRDFSTEGFFEDYKRRVADLADLTKSYNKEPADTANKVSLKGQIAKMEKGLEDFVKNAKKTIEETKFIDSGGSVGKFSEVLQSMQTAFPSLNASMQDLLNVPEEFRKNAFKQAQEYAAALRILESEDAGDADKESAALVVNEFKRKANESELFAVFLKYGETFEKLNAGLARVGVEGFDRDVFRRLPENIQQSLYTSIDAMEKTFLAVDTNKLQGTAKLTAMKLTDDLQAALAREFELLVKVKEAGISFATGVKDNFTSGLSDVFTGESSFEDFLKSMIDNFTRSIINTFIEGFTDNLIGEEGAVMKLLQGIGSSVFADGSFFGKEAEEKLPDLSGPTANLNAGLVTQTAALQSALQLQTLEFVNALKGFLQANGLDVPMGLSASLGEREFSEFSAPLPAFDINSYGSPEVPALVSEDFKANVAGGDTADLGGAFSKPLLQNTAVTAEGFKGMGDIFNMGTGQIVLAIGGLAGSFAAARNGDTIGALLGLATTAVSVFGLGAPAAPVLAAATGGLITGPGTGTSDSIPTWLSDGEYVVNAKATKANRELLHNINFGNAKKYAKGGMVGTSKLMAFTPAAAPVLDSKPAKSAQPIHVTNEFNLTGDLSRQTKQEIIKLGGEISSIVYSNFREKRLMS